MLSKLKTKKFYIPAIILIAIILIVSIYFLCEVEKESNIAIISITGEIISSPRYLDDGSIDKDNTVSLDVVSKIQKAENERKVKAIVFLIDSGGGSSQGGEEIVKAIKEVKKPTVSLIRSQGESSAYWIASATKYIFASETSDLGGIGATMSYVDNAEKNYKDGLTYNQLSSGKYKDMGSPDKPLTADEKKLAMEQINKSAMIFIKGVSDNRHLPIEKVQALADGSAIMAQDALKDGLIDEIGSFADVDRYLSKIFKRNVEIKIPSENIKK